MRTVLALGTDVALERRCGSSAANPVPSTSLRTLSMTLRGFYGARTQGAKTFS